MKLFLIFCLLSLILLSNCETNFPSIGKKKPKETVLDKLISFCFWGAYASPPRPSKQIIDNLDGTISLVEVYSREPCDSLLNGTNQEKQTSKFYSKKCIQGQIYRPVENDCKGSGTISNYFGAVKLQLCPTNISSCGDLSPARISCMKETAGGKTWKNFHNFVSNYGEIKSYFKSRTDEIPFGVSDYFWDSGSSVVFNVDGQLANPTPNYDSFQYILCN